MDPGPQQAAAVIREGDPSQPRPSKPDVKVDPAEPANSNGGRGQEASKDPEKKIKKKKTKTGKKQTDGGKAKKGKKKKQPIPTDESSDVSEDDDDDTSDEESDGSEGMRPEKVLLQKRASKKALVAQKSQSHKSKAQKAMSHSSTKTNKNTNRTPPSKSPASDASESDWDSSGLEDEADDLDTKITNTKEKTKEPNMSKVIREQVARELQLLLLQSAQAQPAFPGYPSFSGGFSGGLGGGGLSGGLGGGLNAGLGGGLGRGLDPGLGLSAFNYPQGQLGALHGLPALTGGQSRSSRSQSKDNGVGGLFGDHDAGLDDDPFLDSRLRRKGSSRTDNKHLDGGSAEQGKKSKKIDYKRVDQVWDNTLHNFKLQATAESNSEDKYDGFCFHVRRTFDWEGKYKATMVDIKSKALRECLQDVIGNIKGVSLVDETPKLDPNVLFL